MRQDEPLPEFRNLIHWAAAQRWSDYYAPRSGDSATRWRRWSHSLGALRRALPPWWRAAHEIARRDGAPRRAQLWHLWRLMAHYPLTPKEFYQFRLYDPIRRMHASRYVFRHWNIGVLGRIEAAHASYWSKLEFRRACRERGLASIPVLGFCRDGTLTAEEDVEGWAGDLYVKPALGAMGRGVQLWPASSHAAIVERCRTLPWHETYIIQPRLRNHPDLAPVSNGNISSLRITTCRTPEGGIEILFPLLQMSAGKTVTDHMIYGNVAAPIDPGTGRLGRAWSYDARFIVSRHDLHPDTGARIPGRIVPFVQETFDLCRRAHGSFRHLIAVGWDVAITAGGPVLIEGNRIFNAPLLQLVWDQPLGDTSYPAALWAQVEQRGFAATGS